MSSGFDDNSACRQAVNDELGQQQPKALRVELVVLTKTKETAIDRHSMPIEAVRPDEASRRPGLAGD